jgi:hypothetical protein
MLTAVAYVLVQVSTEDCPLIIPVGKAERVHVDASVDTELEPEAEPLPNVLVPIM